MKKSDISRAIPALRRAKSTLWALATFGSLLSLVRAQTAAPASTADSSAAGDSVVQLSPFEVTTTHDRGYYAPNTLSGGRINTELKDTPAALTVMNRQFIDDIAATNLYDTEIWTVNASPTYNPANATTGSSNRGPNFSFFSRNYFLWYILSDEFSTERFEFGRGPNGVLFGDGNIGGLASTMTKQAYIGRDRVRFGTRVDSWGGYRSTLDASVSMGDKVALRLNLLNDRGTMWQQHSNKYRDGVHLAGTVRLTEKTTLRFEGEIGKIDRQSYPTNYNENASYWDRTTVYDGKTAPSVAVGGPGLVRVNTSSLYFVDIPSNPAAGYLNWATFYRSTGSNIAMRDNVRTDIPAAMPLLPRRDLNLSPSDMHLLLDYATSTVYLEHKFTDDLFAQVAYNSSRSPYHVNHSDFNLNQYYIDVNTVMPNGAPNPNFGKPYAETTLNLNNQMNTVTEYRGFLAWRFDTSWWKGNVNLLGGDRFDKFDFSQRRLVQTNGTNPNIVATENEYHIREYWDQPINFGDGPYIPGRTFEYARYTNLIIQRKFIDYVQLATVNKFFHDRLTVFLGGRYDHIYQTQRARIRDDATGRPVLGATIIPEGGKVAVATPGAKAVVDKSTSNKNGGVVYFPIPWIGAYYNYSETFSTPDAGNNLIDGTPPPISVSATNEFGIKLNLWDGKIYADARYYDSKQTDAITTTGSAKEINAIWTQLGRTDLNALAYRDTQSLALSGYEFELVGNPTRNLRLTANYTKPKDQRNVNALPGLRAYYAEHIAEWKAAAATNATVQTNIDTIDTLLKNNTTFALVNNMTKYKANFYGTYTFDSGALKNFAVGSGVNFVGPSKVGSGLTAFDYLYSNSFYLLSGHISYETRIGRNKLTLQLNVKNILDEKEPVATSFTNYRVQGVTTNANNFVPANYRFNDPRQFILSAALTF